MPTKGKDNVEVLFLEVYDQQDSGFVMDGTERTPYEQRLNKTTVTWVPCEGTEVFLDEEGVKRSRRIRHISGCESIYPAEQEKLGFFPNRQADKLPIDNGFITVRKETKTVGTFNYFKAATYWFDNPLRPDTATPIYKEIKVNENAVSLIDEDEVQTHAKLKVYALRISRGERKYEYNTDKINSYCNLLNVFAETPEQQIVLIMDKAIKNPKQFLDTIEKAEQTVITEITHALQLNVILFDKNTAMYAEESEVINTVGTGNMSQDRKIEALGSWLQTPEGNTSLTKLRTKLEIAKELQFKA